MLESVNAFEVLMLLTRGGKRFSEIVYDLDMNPKVVAEAINELSATRLVKKFEDKYYLTRKGLRVASIIHRIVLRLR